MKSARLMVLEPVRSTSVLERIKLIVAGDGYFNEHRIRIGDLGVSLESDSSDGCRSIDELLVSTKLMTWYVGSEKTLIAMNKVYMAKNALTDPWYPIILLDVVPPSSSGHIFVSGTGKGYKYLRCLLSSETP